MLLGAISSEALLEAKTNPPLNEAKFWCSEIPEQRYLCFLYSICGDVMKKYLLFIFIVTFSAPDWAAVIMVAPAPKAKIISTTREVTAAIIGTTGVGVSVGSIVRSITDGDANVFNIAREYLAPIVWFSLTAALGAPANSESAFCNTLKETELLLSQDEFGEEVETVVPDICKNAINHSSRRACMHQNAAKYSLPLYINSGDDVFTTELSDKDGLYKLALLDDQQYLIKLPHSENPLLDNNSTYIIKTDSTETVISLDASGNYHRCTFQRPSID